MMTKKDNTKSNNKKHIDHDPRTESAKATFSSEKHKCN